MDSAGVILPPIRASSPQPVHCHEGAEGHVRQAAEDLCVWPVGKIGELVPRIGAEWGDSLALVTLVGSMRSIL